MSPWEDIGREGIAFLQTMRSIFSLVTTETTERKLSFMIASLKLIFILVSISN